VSVPCVPSESRIPSRLILPVILNPLVPARRSPFAICHSPHQNTAYTQRRRGRVRRAHADRRGLVCRHAAEGNDDCASGAGLALRGRRRRTRVMCPSERTTGTLSFTLSRRKESTSSIRFLECRDTVSTPVRTGHSVSKNLLEQWGKGRRRVYVMGSRCSGSREDSEAKKGMVWYTV